MEQNKENDDCSFLSLIKKIEKLDRDVREVKEAILNLRERMLHDDQLAKLHQTPTGEKKHGH